MAQGGTFQATVSAGNTEQFNPGWTSMPTFIQFYLNQEGTGADVISRSCFGWSDGFNNVCHFSYQDSTSGRSEFNPNACLIAYSRVSGTLTKVFEAYLVSFDNLGGGQYGFTLHIVTNTQGFPVSAISL